MLGPFIRVYGIVIVALVLTVYSVEAQAPPSGPPGDSPEATPPAEEPGERTERTAPDGDAPTEKTPAEESVDEAEEDPPAVKASAEEPIDDAESDQELMAELEAATAADAEETTARSKKPGDGADGAVGEDPLLQVAEGAKEVMGNEMNPSLSIILDVAGAYFSQRERLRMGGHAPTTNGPAIQGAELAASANVDPFFRVDLAFGMWHLHVEEVFLTTVALPLNLQLRAGQFKSNIGRHNPTHLHQWRFVVHPLPNQYLFGSEGLALPGAELSVLLPLPWYLELVGALQVGESGSFRTKPLSEGDPGYEDFVYPLRLVQFFDLSDALALQVGLNAVLGTSPSAPERNNRSTALGLDTLLKWRPIGWGDTGYTFVAWVIEGWYRQTEVADDLWDDMGCYSDLVFGMDKQWEAALRGEVWHRLGGADVHPDLDRNVYGRDVIRGSAVLSFMPSHFSRVRWQYSFEHPAGLGDNHIGLLQLEVSAGAHGAHRY